MRMPRPRLTIRRLMLVVAIVGVVLGTSITIRRRATEFESRAAAHREKWIKIFTMTEGSTGDTPERRRRLGHLAEMDLKYQRAARYPWLPVAADPPEPK